MIFCWLPSHAGIKGNELADKEAKAAIGLDVISTQEIPVSDIKAYIKRKVYDDWRFKWKTKEKYKRVKLHTICPTIRRTPINLNLPRKDTWKLTRLRIGHTRYTHSYHYMADAEPPACIECEAETSVEHILIGCGNYALERLVHYDPREVSLQELLTNKQYVIKVLQFLKDIGLYSEI